PQPAPSERTQYGYKNDEGHRLHIMADRIKTGHVMLSVTGVGDLEPRSMNIRDKDVPGVALALLKAAGVEPHNGTELVRGDRRDMWAVRNLMDHVEAQAEDAAEKELTRRRGEIAAEHGVGGGAYATASI